MLKATSETFILRSGPGYVKEFRGTDRMPLMTTDYDSALRLPRNEASRMRVELDAQHKILFSVEQYYERYKVAVAPHPKLPSEYELLLRSERRKAFTLLAWFAAGLVIGIVAVFLFVPK